MTNKKGQGSTEYLVILAVVLIVALVAVALLGFFPGLATDSQESQSEAYWTGTATPFKIMESKGTANTLTVILQNSNSKKLTLTTFSANGANATIGTNGVFLGGEKKGTAFNVTITGLCVGSTRYSISGNTIYFIYDSSSLTGQKQGGDAAVKDLVGMCN